MIQYNTLNVKLSDSQLNKLKLGIKDGTEVTLKISSSIVDDSNGKNNFLQEFLFTNTQDLRLRKAFPNSYLANIKLSKTQFHKIGQSGGFLVRMLVSVLIPLGSTAAGSATEQLFFRKCLDLVVVLFDLPLHPSELALRNKTLIIWNEEMNDIIKIVESLEKSELLVKGVSEAIKNEAKEQKGRFLGML